jgi:UDP-N-acetylmuramoylalanine--D-glutamate ligase
MKKIVILGGGKSGIGAAILAKKKKYKVFLSEKNYLKKKYKNILLKKKISFEEFGHTEKKILKNNLIIKSPGIHPNNYLIKKIKLLNIPIISEISFAQKYVSYKKIIAVTGSNGKTTTSSLIHFIIKKSGISSELVGNIGYSFADKLYKKKSKFYILEISSFQLDDSPKFHSNISILLNITPDHMDWYNKNFNNYINSKFRITKFQTKKNFFIYNYDDLIIRKYIKKQPTKAFCIPFSLKKSLPLGAFLKKKKIIFIYKNFFLKIKKKKIKLKGEHNIYNIMASVLTIILLGISKKNIKKYLFKFKNLEHRLELFIEINQVKFINDSKSTNINSAFYALKSINTPIIWIAGGKDKGNNYKKLNILVKKKVKALICIGLDNKNIISFFKKKINTIIEIKNIKKAVKKSFLLSKKGYSILLSPACSSIDKFKNYKDRGLQFKKEVKNLLKKNNNS